MSSRDRTELEMIFKEILGSDNVYFSPPAKIHLHFPCIIYKLKGINTRTADNINYAKFRQYDIQLIDENPDSPFVDKILDIPRTRQEGTPYSVDHLMHYNFSIIF